MADQRGSTNPPGGQRLISVGIPLGRLPTETGSGPQYLISRGAEFFALEPLEYAVFCCSKACVSREQLAANMERDSGRSGQETATAVQALLDRQLLLQLSGSQPADWPRLCTLRVIPRAMAIGSINNPAGSFALLHFDGKTQIVLDAVGFALWSRFNGMTRLDGAVEEVSEDSGFTEVLLRECSHELVVSLANAGMLLLDI
jgi:hypothetical protein